MSSGLDSQPDVTETYGGGDVDELPEFDLGYAFNDRIHPTEITVYDHGPKISTRWITVDVDTAIPLEEVA